METESDEEPPITSKDTNGKRMQWNQKTATRLEEGMGIKKKHVKDKEGDSDEQISNHMSPKEPSKGESPLANDTKEGSPPPTKRSVIISKIGGKPAKTPETSPKKQVQSRISGKRLTSPETTAKKQIQTRIGGSKASEESSPKRQIISRVGGRPKEASPILEPATEVKTGPQQPPKRELTVEERVQENREKLRRELEEQRSKHQARKVRKF